MTRSRPVVVIGHVDHGKSALVRALTGTQTDRLPEEKARGLSIALGFAHRAYPGGILDFVDAPGHEDFIRTMVAGATGATAALVIVSAADGVAAQTREHVRIAVHLGLTKGLVVFTKSDLVSAAGRDGLEADCLAEIEALGFSPQDTVFCSAHTGEGLDVLHTALAGLFEEREVPPGPNGAFLPIDRVFSPAGVGTVVTGTLQGADLTPDGAMVLGFTGGAAPIRRIQVHGAEVSHAVPGQRVAVNLRGVGADAVRRGDVLCEAGRFEASSRLLVRLHLSADPAISLKHAQEVRLLLGTDQVIADVRLLEDRRLEPGAQAFAELRLAAPVVAFAGQRAILRRLSPAQTLGGALVLDPAPPPIRRRDPAMIDVLHAVEQGDAAALVDRLAARGRGVFPWHDVTRLTRGPAPPEIDAGLADLGHGVRARESDLDTARDAIEAQLAACHGAHPLKAGIPLADLKNPLPVRFDPRLIDHAFRLLMRAGVAKVQGGYAALSSHDPLAHLSGPQAAALASLERALREGGVVPPEPATLAALVPDGEVLLELLTGCGRAVSLYNHALRRFVVFHGDSLAEAARRLSEAFPPPLAFTTGAARAALDTSRKFIVPMLEHFDAEGLTVRDGDQRAMAVPPSQDGPALPAAPQALS